MNPSQIILNFNDANKFENTAKLNTVYFGVNIPNDNNNGQAHVFEDKEAALKVAKKHKKSRFKSFQFYHEAVEFSLNGADCSTIITGDGLDSEKKELASTIGEKASPFRTPRPQELTEFRKKIETGNFNYVREMIELNPRYLVSSGDTPSILQEGARLNALHVAAKARNVAIIEFILNTISSPEFVKKLYGDDNQENAEQRCRMLLDLYLNTPNKGFNDTPLHIASKWGADKVIEILLSYPECDRTKRNTHGKLAEDLICERVDGKIPDGVKKRIHQLLYDSYYVPVLRTEDNTMPPAVGEPFSPTSPPVLNRNPLSPRFEIHAYAGPMDKTEAESFRKVWKTPPRSLSFNSPNGKKTPGDKLTMLRLKDPEKGLERIGKKLANNFNVCWKEYWDFLDCFVDIASEEGLEMLEKHLESKKKDLQGPFEVSSPLVSKPETVVSPITSLCNVFSACKIEDSTSMFSEDWQTPLDYKQICRPLVYVDKACQVFANRMLANVSSILRCNECEYENIAKTLETDIKLLELLMNSYMDDERFMDWVNFQKFHSRVAHLFAKKILENNKDCNDLHVINKMEFILESIVKRSDYFSSDDEGANCKETTNKPTVYRRQVVCLLSRIKHYLESPLAFSDLSEENITLNAWDVFDVCNCIFHPKKPKRNNLSRNGSFKSNLSRARKIDLQCVSKKLFDDDLLSPNSLVGENGDLTFNFSDSSKSVSDDEFYTPPASPVLFHSEHSSDSEDVFSDAEPPKLEVFLEGAYPTKTDRAVYSALRFAECNIDRNKFPLIYKWHHLISLYKETERQGWPSPHHQPIIETPRSPQEYLTSKPSWMRITGANSPRAVMKSYSSHKMNYYIPNQPI